MNLSMTEEPRESLCGWSIEDEEVDAVIRCEVPTIRCEVPARLVCEGNSLDLILRDMGSF